MGVRTPWGDSEELRERRLTPGPGNVREEVEQNQRERLFGAMVASVAERGYEATTMGHLAELSGVSSRTAYDLFGDKEAVFVATLQAVIGVVLMNVVAAVEAKGLTDNEERGRAASRAFAETLVSEQAAARMVLIDAFAAGPKALAPIEGLVAIFEERSRQNLEQSAELAAMPGEMIEAYMGAIEEIARTRLLLGTEAELPDLTGALWDLFGSFRPPPRPLRLNGRVPRVASESLEAHDQAERVLRAFAVAVAEKGYAATRVSDAVRVGKMSMSTFYAHFQGKEEAMLAAIDSAGAQMGAAMVPAIRRARDWPRAVRATIGALFNFLASRPALARLLSVEVYAAGPEALRRRVEYLAPLERLIGEAPDQSEAPGITVELLAGVVYSLARRRVREKGPGALPKLAPLCSYLALMPYIGAEEAAGVANEEGRR